MKKEIRRLLFLLPLALLALLFVNLDEFPRVAPSFYALKRLRRSDCSLETTLTFINHLDPAVRSVAIRNLCSSEVVDCYKCLLQESSVSLERSVVRSTIERLLRHGSLEDKIHTSRILTNSMTLSCKKHKCKNYDFFESDDAALRAGACLALLFQAGVDYQRIFEVVFSRRPDSVNPAQLKLVLKKLRAIVESAIYTGFKALIDFPAYPNSAPPASPTDELSSLGFPFFIRLWIAAELGQSINDIEPDPIVDANVSRDLAESIKQFIQANDSHKADR